MVSHAKFGLLLVSEKAGRRTQADNAELRSALRLALEDVRDSGHGIELKLLIGVELDLHSRPVRLSGRW